MVDFAQRNAERAGVAQAVQLRGGDALQRMPPCDQPGVMLLEPAPRRAHCRRRYRQAATPANARPTAPGPGCGPRRRRPKTAASSSADGGQLATHWKKNYSGWTAWMLTPDLKLPGKMRLERIAPRADVERPHRMPHVPLPT